MDVLMLNGGFVLNCWRTEYLESNVGSGCAGDGWWNKGFERRKISTEIEFKTQIFVGSWSAVD